MTPFTWALLAALCWGFAPAFEKAGLRGGIDPSVGVFIRSLGVLLGALCFLPFWNRIGARLIEVPLRTWLLLFLGGIAASIVGQLCFYRALKFGEVSRVVPIGASYPVIAFFMGLLIWKEAFTVGKACGVILIVAGLFLLR